MKRRINIKFDTATKKWLDDHPFAQTTMTRCSDCGLYYKPSLGHTCKEKSKKE